MIRSICKPLTIVVGLSWSSGAGAVMIQAEDYFRNATDQEISQIRSALKQMPTLDVDKTRILILEGDKRFFPHLNYKVVVVRMENMCIYSKCISAVFKDNIDQAYFHGFISLPAKMAVGDMPGPACSGCEKGEHYVFEAPDGGSKSIVLTEFGPVF